MRSALKNLKLIFSFLYKKVTGTDLTEALPPVGSNDSPTINLDELADLAAFHETNVKKHYGELKGWHTELTKETAAEEKTRHAMTVVLIDNDRYQ